MTKKTLTNWYISESTTNVNLDENGRGEVMFTVTNRSTAADRVVLIVEPLDGAANAWITLPDTGAKAVPAGESVTYLAVVAVPATVPAATYGFQVRAYSADADPSETSAISRRITFAKPLAAPTSKRGRLRWPYLAIPVALLVVVFGIWLVLRDPDPDLDPEVTATTVQEDPDPEVTTTTEDPDPVVSVAAVVGKPFAEAQGQLEAQQLKVVIQEVDQSGTPGRVVSQEPAHGLAAAAGDTVTLQVVTYHLKDLVGGTADQATTWLNGKGLTATRTTRSDSAAVGTVLATHPGANTVLSPGDAVALEVSSGPAPVYQVLRTRPNDTDAGRCLEIGSSTPNVSAMTCNSLAQQQWAFIQVSDDHYLLKNKGNALCLEVPFNNGSDDVRLITAACNSALPQQQWHQGNYRFGGHHIMNWGTGKCMDKSFWDHAVQWGCDAGKWWQHWAAERI